MHCTIFYVIKPLIVNIQEALISIILRKAKDMKEVGGQNMEKCHKFQLVEAITTQNLVKRLGRSFAITLILLVQYRGKKSLFSSVYLKRRCRCSMANCITEKHHRIVMWPFEFVRLMSASTTFGCSFGNFIWKISAQRIHLLFNFPL